MFHKLTKKHIAQENIQDSDHTDFAARISDRSET